MAAMQAGQGGEIVDELMEALRFDRLTTGPDRSGDDAVPAGR